MESIATSNVSVRENGVRAAGSAMRCGAAFVLAAWLLLPGGSARAEATLFDWSEDACEKWDIPDTPARFWRDQGGLGVISGSEGSRVSRGPVILSLKRDCDVVFQGHHDPDPQDHDDRAWVNGV